MGADDVARAVDDPRSACPVVGIGASAGGLAAFEAFFAALPTEAPTGLAFVLVQHLAPDHPSLLAELIGRRTAMPVFEAEDGTVVQPDRVYTIPPGHEMGHENGRLVLTAAAAAAAGHRLPVDAFFRALALDLGPKAVGIVLSGTGSDGTAGVRAIKAEGGMVMAQTAASAEFDGMPRSALATGLVDYELAPGEMPARLLAYVRHAMGVLPGPDAHEAAPRDAGLASIFALLRHHTHHDFSRYKPSTIQRRVERRMAVQQIDAIERYVAFLQRVPAEVEALFRDMLIGVTQFFRDPQAFAALQAQVLPKLFANRPAGAPVRVWVTGCSTGEEAYTLAILLREQQEASADNALVQIFATDIDSRAIATARAGVYPASIAADLTPQRLARFFSPELDGGYRIVKPLRDMLIFSEHDVARDPPFSRLELVSCRNLLIYMGAELQQQLMPMFHTVLNPGGFLFLGSSETVGEFGDIFVPQDRASKLYQRRDALRAVRRTAGGRLPILTMTPGVRAPQPPARLHVPARPSLREMTEQAILGALAPSAALVNALGEVLYLHGRTGVFLEPSPGEGGVNNILKMARDGLQHELTMALHQAARSGKSVQRAGLPVRNAETVVLVDLTVEPVAAGPAGAPEQPVFLVLLAGRVPVATAPGMPTEAFVSPSAQDDPGASVASLRRELRVQADYLQTVNEELEASNDELRAANEAAQSTNEELQSTNEELETSKEELQSVNEELATVNTELQAKVTDLSRANNDMNNLLAGTGIATIFVDHALRILRFTPTASEIINLIPGDVGRQVAHIVSNLVGYDRMVPDAKAVLHTLVPKEVDVLTTRGRWYTMRIQPYRTLDNVIEGAVITFVDITSVVRTREALSQANALLRLAVVVRDAHDALTVQDLAGQTLAWNPGAVRLYGWTEAEALLMNVQDRIAPALREPALATVRRLAAAEVLPAYTSRRLTKGGAEIEVTMVSTALLDETGRMYAVATTERAQAPAGATPRCP